jgi:hypothetical protein
VLVPGFKPVKLTNGAAARYLQRKLDPLSCPWKEMLKCNVPGLGVITVLYTPPDEVVVEPEML